MVEPVPEAPAAVVDAGGDRTLVFGDYHAGLEAALRAEGVELPSRADARRERALELVDATDAERVVVLGDLGHAIGVPEGPELDELDRLLSELVERVRVTVLKGNHDGDLGETLVELGLTDVEVTGTTGIRTGDVGFAHGHTWPAPEVLAAPTVCVGHEHPVVRLEDELGAARDERVWLRGRLHPDPFEAYHGCDVPGGELVVFPSFNDLAGGTWVNVEGREFLCPFLPEGLAEGEAFLLDGTRLGDYRSV